MDRINTSTKAVDLFGAGKHGFRDGNPQTALLATYLSALWFNNAQEELAGVVEAGGSALNGADLTQLKTTVALHVESIAALKALAAPALAAGRTLMVNVRGYYADGDGGGGGFYWAQNSNEADNLGTVIIPNSAPANGRWKRARSGDRVNARWFGVKGDDLTVNTAAITAALAAMTNGGLLYFPSGTESIYRSAAVVAPNANTTIHVEEGAVLKFPVLGLGVAAITATADNFTLRGRGTVQGPAAGAYVTDEICVKMVGTSSAVRKKGLRISGVELKNFGSYGIYGKWLDDIWLTGIRSHDHGHSGATFLSCDNGIVQGCKFFNITPGTGGEMYGISLTHDSTNYNLDPNAGTKAALNPFCRGWQLIGNEVYGVAWNAIDTHGAYELTVLGNRTYGAKNGIQVPTSSGGALNYSGWTNIVGGNIVDARNRDGSASGNENLGIGINVSGGATLSQARVICEENIVHGYGVKSNGAGCAISASFLDNGLVSTNTITSWGGQAVICNHSNATISNNIFGGCADAADTRKHCIQHDAGVSKQLVIIGNVHAPLGGNAAASGLRLNGSTTPDVFLGPNDFSKVTGTPITHSAELYMRGGGCGNVIKSVADDATPSVLTLVAGGPGELVINASTGPYNLTALDDGVPGQVVTILNTLAAVVTVVNGVAMKLPGGVNLALGQYDSVTLTQITGGIWVAVGKSDN